MESSQDDNQRNPVDRRAFFRRALFLGLDGVEQSGREAAKRLAETVGAKEAVPRTVRQVRYLRPPGALPETAFLDTCSRCGECAKACPAQCIELHEDIAGGGPHIIARQSPCVICTDLSCMKVCPTGALKLVDEVAQIDMGIAVMNHPQCLRTPRTGHQGEDCRVCVTQCPIGEEALTINMHSQVEVRDGCTGCGVCERVCPTEPAAIIVQPHL